MSEAAAPSAAPAEEAKSRPRISAEVVAWEIVDGKAEGSSKSLFFSTDFAIFTIKIASSSDGYNSYRVKRRYRQFDTLHTTLRATYRGLPELPSKASGKDDETRAAARKEGLTSYLRTILADPVVSKSDDLAIFLELHPSQELYGPTGSDLAPTPRAPDAAAPSHAAVPSHVEEAQCRTPTLLRSTGA